MPNIISFWKTSDYYGCFSNWWICNFEKDGINFTSSEQALMYEKAVLFNDKEIALQILKTDYQKEIKALGRAVRNYDEKVWSFKRYSIMVDILKCKFSQNEDLKNRLIETGDAILIENSPYDKIWGNGSLDVNCKNGENLLGLALMEVRTFLKNNM